MIGLSGFVTILAVLTAVSLMVSLARGSYAPQQLEIRSIRPQAESGLLTEIEVTVENRTSVSMDLVFNVMWAGHPHRWVPEHRPLLPGYGRESFRLEPSRVEAIPPVTLAPEGRVHPQEFRLRIHQAGHSSFLVSDVVRLSPVEAGLVNSRFRFWGTSADSRAPLGWNAATRLAPGATAAIEPLSTEGVRTAVRHSGQTDQGWVEVALLQSLARVHSCYEMVVRYSRPEPDTRGEMPLTPSGVQFIQEERSVWFLPSSEPEVWIVTLDEQTTIVGLPAEAATWSVLNLEVAAYAPEIVGSEGAMVKVFNAVNEKSQGRSVFEMEYLTEGRC